MNSTAMEPAASFGLSNCAPGFPCGRAALGAITGAHRTGGSAPTGPNGPSTFGIRGLNVQYFAGTLMNDGVEISAPPQATGVSDE